MIQLVEQALSKAFSQATYFEKKTRAQIRESISQKVAETVRKAVESDYLKDAPGEPAPYTSFLFVGDAVDGSFMVEVHKSLLHTDHIDTGYAAIGSGDIFPYYAMAALKHYRVKQRPLREVKLIACRILEDAINTAAFGLGEPIQMIEVEKRKSVCGVAAKLSREDIRTLQDAVTQWKEVEGEALTTFVGIREVEDPAIQMPELETSAADEAPAEQ